MPASDSRETFRFCDFELDVVVHAGLGERDATFEWLDRAYEARDIHLVFLPVDPRWDAYRSDPRFTALVERCGFTSGVRRP